MWRTELVAELLIIGIEHTASAVFIVFRFYRLEKERILYGLYLVKNI